MVVFMYCVTSLNVFVFVCQGTHENPELIWNDEAREKVCSTVRQMKDEYEIVHFITRLV